MADYNVQIKNIILQDDLYYKRNLLLSYKIEYPQFYSDKFQKNLNKINECYKIKALKLERECYEISFKIAIEQYEYSVRNDFPIRKYEIFFNYKITFNQDCVISLYFDKYQYMGGAHGSTIRVSDTWNIQSGNRIMLYNMFNSTVKYIQYILIRINRQIEIQLNTDEKFMYFDNYERKVFMSFDINNFYLTKYGVVIYFQQYDIAPYASGIPEFMIPYHSGVVICPKCK